jgi:hypothetical protein
MKLKVIIAVSVVAATAWAPLAASAQKVLTGDTKLACEALLCLAAPTRPAECAASITKYFSISLSRFSKTLRARKNFLSLCPRVEPSIINQVLNDNPPEPDPPDVPLPVPCDQLNQTSKCQER